MADPLESYLSGIPDIRSGSPSIFGSGSVSITDADRLVRQRLQDRVSILDTRQKLGAIRDKEVSRIQGQAAIRELSTLDPSEDPDYDLKVSRILSRNPSATLDDTVNNFLQIQGGIFDRVEKDRQEQRDFESRRILEQEEQRLMLVRERQRLGQETQIRMDAKTGEEIAALPAETLLRFGQYRKNGMDPKSALAMVRQEEQDATTLQELIELGYDPEGPEIMGVPDAKGRRLGGVYNKYGLIDPKQVAILKGQAKRKQQEEKDTAAIRRQQDLDLRNLERIMQRADESGDTALATQTKAAIDRILSDRGLLPGAESGKVGNAGTAGTPSPVRRDFSEADRYIPR